MSFLFDPILMTFSSSVIAFLPLALSFQLSSASAALHSVRSTPLPSVLACSGISLTSSSSLLCQCCCLCQTPRDQLAQLLSETPRCTKPQFPYVASQVSISWYRSFDSVGETEYLVLWWRARDIVGDVQEARRVPSWMKALCRWTGYRPILRAL